MMSWSSHVLTCNRTSIVNIMSMTDGLKVLVFSIDVNLEFFFFNHCSCIMKSRDSEYS